MIRKTQDLKLIDDYELAFVASAIIDPAVIDQHADRISGADFQADPKLAALWELLKSMRQAGTPIDGATLSQHAVEAGIIGDDFTKADLAKIITATHTATHAGFYAAKIRDQAERLRLLDVAQAIITDANDQRTITAADIARSAEQRLQAIGADSGSHTRTIGEAAMELVNELERRTREGGDRTRAIFSGLFDVDQLTGGTCPGELCIVAARPGNGKSSYAMQVSKRAAERGQGVLFVSLEMTRLELVARVICGMTDVSASDIRSGNLTRDQWREINEASRDLQPLPLTIADPPSATINQICGMAKLHKASRKPLELLVIDYVGLIRSTSKAQNDWEKMAEITASVKRLAKELKVPVLLLAQLNREADHGEPKLSNLARSASLEQDADQVLFLHRERENENDFNLIVAKNRHGESHRKVPVTFNEQHTRFEDRQSVTPTRYAEFD